MPCQNPRCMGKYDYNHIAYFAKRRFIEGCNTIELLGAAKSDREKEAIALVCLLHLDDEMIQELNLCCNATAECKTINYRDKLKKMLAQELEKIPLSS